MVALPTACAEKKFCRLPYFYYLCGKIEKIAMHHTREDLLRLGITPEATKHNQHRRAAWADYAGTGLYMVTLCVEGRQPVFGRLEGDIRAQRGTGAFPHLVPSALGRAILTEELPKIHACYPQVELWQAALMPDHLHLLLFVRQPLPPKKRLGQVIGAFMGGCSRAWWRQTALTAQTAPAPALPQQPPLPPTADAAGTPAAVFSSAGTAAGPAALSAAPPSAAAPSAAVPGASAPGVPAPAAARRPLFEQGYHDRIIKRPGMLETIKRYMADNPLRALMRRALPALLERRLHLRIAGRDYAAFGCLFLLKRAEKEPVFYHRRDRDSGQPTELTAAFANARDRQLAEARQGVVLVSPSISNPERIVINTAIDEGLPVINLQKEPIGPYWKPERRRFEACARGTLLILTPWGIDEALHTDYERFHRLNDLAAEICNTTDATLVDLHDLTDKKTTISTTKMT